MSDSMLYKLFDKKTSGSGVKSEIISNQELATELQKPVIRKFENRKVQSSFMDNIWGADLADMLLINLIKDFVPYYVFLIFSVYTLYTCFICFKDKKDITITNAFQNILDESNRKQKTIQVDKGSKFYNRSIRLWLQDNDIEMYYTNNERKSVLAKRFIRTSMEKFINT